MEQVKPVKVFYNYAREDENEQQTLEKHLTILRRSGQATTWSDAQIQGGTNWQKEVEKHLNTAQIILLLISPDFLASEQCFRTTKRAIERYQAGEAQVIPILLRPTFLEGTPISELKPLPTNGVPLEYWSDRDQAFTNIARGIRQAIKELTPPVAEMPQPTSTLAEQLGGLGLDEQHGAILVYVSEKLRKNIIELYGSPFSDNKIHSSMTVVERVIDGQKRLLAIFPSLSPDSYSVFTSLKHYTTITVHPNQVAEVDWR